MFVPFFKCLHNFKAYALQLELSKVSISNFVKFQLQIMSFKIAQAFAKRTKLSIKIGQKRHILSNYSAINQSKIHYMRKNTFFVMMQ